MLSRTSANRAMSDFTVIPANAGIQPDSKLCKGAAWTPACAGATAREFGGAGA